VHARTGYFGQPFSIRSRVVAKRMFARERSHSSGRLSDRPWIVIVVVVNDASAMTLGTGDDVAVLILDPALATALRTDFHAAT
jgi:hypothetical protein